MKIKTAAVLILAGFSLVATSQPSIVKIAGDNGQKTVLVDGKPFYVKGIVGESNLEKISLYGGNSLRTGSQKENLDRAHQLGLKVLVNLPARSERNGMDYNDAEEVRKQTERIISIVEKTKDHPAVLMWAIGNELDYIPGTKPFNPKVWDAINSAALAIKAIDPNHPVMTVIGTSMMQKVSDIVKRCPDLDLLGINTYGDIYTLSQTLRKYGWTKPYVIAEWGPDGYWEVKKTPWGAPYEQTGREKYDCYEKKYKSNMTPENNQCLGSYVFYWSNFKQETTHTWFCMFDSTGLESPQVGLMHTMWTGKKKTNVAPIVDSVNIEKFVRYQAVYLKAGASYKAKVSASDENGDKLTYRWEIRPEAKYASYAGQGEAIPVPVAVKGEKSEAQFTAPGKDGAYRLFVYAYDGKGHFSTANMPFYVGVFKKEPAK